MSVISTCAPRFVSQRINSPVDVHLFVLKESALKFKTVIKLCVEV